MAVDNINLYLIAKYMLKKCTIAAILFFLIFEGENIKIELGRQQIRIQHTKIR